MELRCRTRIGYGKESEVFLLLLPSIVNIVIKVLSCNLQRKAGASVGGMKTTCLAVARICSTTRGRISAAVLVLVILARVSSRRSSVNTVSAVVSESTTTAWKAAAAVCRTT